MSVVAGMTHFARERTAVALQWSIASIPALAPGYAPIVTLDSGKKHFAIGSQ
ncbi:hypothetical protein V2S85_02780 [Novosphingobium resinovorum]|nr:hypothetical protein [Novosphingobium resinovorum]